MLPLALITAVAGSAAVAATGTGTTGGSWLQWAVAGTLATAIVALAAGATVAWIRRWSPSGSGATPEAATDPRPERVCPTCAERFPADASFCPRDASPLAWVEGELGTATLHCPRCERDYHGGMRYCPIDAEELVRAQAEGEDPTGHAHRHAIDLSGSAMICPVCAARYEDVAAFCGRDGSRLSPLN